MLKDKEIALKADQKSLLIISHTEHFFNHEGKPCGWTPTVREIDFLAGHFKEVIHLAVLHPGTAPASTAPYSAKNIRFEHIPPFGGAGMRNKLRILWVLPFLWIKMHRLLKKADLFQFRAPTSIGLMVIPVLTLFYRKKKGWFKYAGNWMQPNMPLSYKGQKQMLEKWQKRPVTINGHWQGQPKHVHSLENPCLSESELPEFRKQASIKNWNHPFTGCFVGRLDDAKGVHRIVELLLMPGIEQRIKTFHFVGDGPGLETYRQALANSKVHTVFHGFCSREQTFALYAVSHILLLPSNSEGFPKVVAEAASFGCVPLVSDVSSIGQYINEANGFLWTLDGVSFKDFAMQSLVDARTFQNRSSQLPALAERFTFEHFFKSLSQTITTH